MVFAEVRTASPPAHPASEVVSSSRKAAFSFPLSPASCDPMFRNRALVAKGNNNGSRAQMSTAAGDLTLDYLGVPAVAHTNGDSPFINHPVPREIESGFGHPEVAHSGGAKLVLGEDLGQPGLDVVREPAPCREAVSLSLANFLRCTHDDLGTRRESVVHFRAVFRATLCCFRALLAGLLLSKDSGAATTLGGTSNTVSPVRPSESFTSPRKPDAVETVTTPSRGSLHLRGSVTVAGNSPTNSARQSTPLECTS